VALSVPRQEYAKLRRRVRQMEKHFIQRHLSVVSLTPTEAELFDAAAFAVLSHGALENFVENVALWVVDRVTTRWTADRKATPSTAAILWHGSPPAKPKDGQKLEKIYDQLRDGIDERKQALSTLIFDNHGVSIRHLQTLFYPLGVNVPHDPILSPSLKR
jgi:hypothetical protein